MMPETAGQWFALAGWALLIGAAQMIVGVAVGAWLRRRNRG